MITLNMFFIRNNFPAYILYQVSNASVIIKMCYVHNQWYDISCATLYIGLYARYLLFLSDFNENWGLLDIFKKNDQI